VGGSHLSREILVFFFFSSLLFLSGIVQSHAFACLLPGSIAQDENLPHFPQSPVCSVSSVS
jgi:hypothetical protein